MPKKVLCRNKTDYSKLLTVKSVPCWFQTLWTGTGYPLEGSKPASFFLILACFTEWCSRWGLRASIMKRQTEEEEKTSVNDHNETNTQVCSLRQPSYITSAQYCLSHTTPTLPTLAAHSPSMSLKLLSAHHHSHLSLLSHTILLPLWPDQVGLLHHHEALQVALWPRPIFYHGSLWQNLQIWDGPLCLKTINDELSTTAPSLLSLMFPYQQQLTISITTTIYLHLLLLRLPQTLHHQSDVEL